MKLLAVLILLLISNSLFAHEPDDMATLKAANDALTIRVAELLEENARLQAFVEQALLAQSAGRAVSRGCDPQDLRRTLVEGSGTPSSANEWLKKNADDCTATDLTYIIQNVNSWTSYVMNDSVRLAQYYRDQK